MKIALISSINRPVGPYGNGGIPVFNYLLAHGLNQIIKTSDRITLFTSGNSKSPVPKHSIIPEALFKDTEDAHIKSHEKIELENNSFDIALKYIKEKNYNIVHHNHFNSHAVAKSVELGLNTIVTVHVSKDTNFIKDLSNRKILSKIKFVAISQTIADIYPEIDFNQVIHNGINLEEFIPNYDIVENYFSWIGRITPEKGLREAIIVAKKNKSKIRFAGPITDLKYFNDVKKEFSPDTYEYLGLIDNKQRNNLLNQSKAMLFPLQWDEPFGLTVIESLACGTPVLTLNHGDMRQIIIQNKTGFVCDNMSDLMYKASQTNKLSRIECRKSAEANFSHILMAKKYYKLIYENN